MSLANQEYCFHAPTKLSQLFKRNISQHCWIVSRHVVTRLVSNAQHVAIYCSLVAKVCNMLCLLPVWPLLYLVNSFVKEEM